MKNLNTNTFTDYYENIMTPFKILDILDLHY